MENTAQKFQELQNKCSLHEQQIEELTAKVNWYEEQSVVNYCPGPKACRPSAGSEKKVMKYPPLRMWVLFSAYQ